MQGTTPNGLILRYSGCLCSPLNKFTFYKLQSTPNILHNYTTDLDGPETGNQNISSGVEISYS